MDGAALQDRLSRSWGAAARIMGLPHDLFRARGASFPVKAERRILRLPASFDGGDPGYRRPTGYERTLRGMFDCAYTQVGDYMTGPRGVLFIVAQPLLYRPLCVLTTGVVDILRPSGPGVAGLNGYGGVREPLLRTVLEEWPAEILGGRDGGKGALPDDGGLPGFTVLLPPTPAAIEGSDLVRDGEGRRFVVRTAERSEMGWRLLVRQAGI